MSLQHSYIVLCTGDIFLPFAAPPTQYRHISKTHLSSGALEGSIRKGGDNDELCRRSTLIQSAMPRQSGPLRLPYLVFLCRSVSIEAPRPMESIYGLKFAPKSEKRTTCQTCDSRIAPWLQSQGFQFYNLVFIYPSLSVCTRGFALLKVVLVVES